MVTVILCVFLLSYVYGEGKVSTILLPPSQKTLLSRIAEQLLQRKHSRAYISRHCHGLLRVRIQLGFEYHGYQQVRDSRSQSAELQDYRQASEWTGVLSGLGLLRSVSRSLLSKAFSKAQGTQGCEQDICEHGAQGIAWWHTHTFGTGSFTRWYKRPRPLLLYGTFKYYTPSHTQKAYLSG